MNVLIISYHTSPFGEVGLNDSGGLNTYLANTAKFLSEKSNLTIVTGEVSDNFSSKNKKLLSQQLFEKEALMEEKINLREEFEANLETYIEFSNIDIVHSHYWLSGLIGDKISKKYNIPHIFTAHSYGEFLQLDTYLRTKSEKNIIQNATRVTVSSKYEESLLAKKYDCKVNNISTITPGLDKELFFKKENGRSNKILSIGRIQEQKGQKEIIKLFEIIEKQIPDTELCFIGGPSGNDGREYLDQLKHYVVSQNLEDKVKFVGALSPEEIAKQLNSSKLLVHNSQFETFGLVAIEANACGIPVVSSNTNTLSEIIENDINGYLSDSLFDEGVIDFILKVLSSESYFENVSDQSVKAVEKFNWETTADKIYELYQEVKFS
jgi:D-inositol-3-phosphate glycosyltransferase